MPCYVAFLRGVSPLNAKMPALKACFEAAGFTAVRPVLGSGNVVFDARLASEAALERRAEAAMRRDLGSAFFTIVRPVARLQELLASDPYAGYRVAPEAKRVVSFLREARAPKLALPLSQDAATVHAAVGREVFSSYRPTDKGPVFMKLIESAFGSEITTRTWDTVRKCVVS